jgi:hypothetical protein
MLRGRFAQGSRNELRERLLLVSVRPYPIVCTIDRPHRLQHREPQRAVVAAHYNEEKSDEQRAAGRGRYGCRCGLLHCLGWTTRPLAAVHLSPESRARASCSLSLDDRQSYARRTLLQRLRRSYCRLVPAHVPAIRAVGLAGHSPAIANLDHFNSRRLLLLAAHCPLQRFRLGVSFVHGEHRAFFRSEMGGGAW